MHRRVSGTILMVLGSLGCSANLLVVLLLLLAGTPGLGLLVHQCAVDCARQGYHEGSLDKNGHKMNGQVIFIIG